MKTTRREKIIRPVRKREDGKIIREEQKATSIQEEMQRRRRDDRSNKKKNKEGQKDIKIRVYPIKKDYWTENNLSFLRRLEEVGKETGVSIGNIVEEDNKNKAMTLIWATPIIREKILSLIKRKFPDSKINCSGFIEIDPEQEEEKLKKFIEDEIRKSSSNNLLQKYLL